MATLTNDKDLVHNDPTRLHAQQLLLLACGGRLSRVVHVLAELGVADILADGPLPVDVIAKKAGAHTDALYRILRNAASVGIFEEGPAKVFQLTPLADGLRSDNGDGVLPLVKYNNLDLTARPFDEIMHSVRTGEPAVERALGMPFNVYLEKNPEVGLFFDEFMSFWSRQFIEEELEQYHFERFASLADLGGGDGFFLAQVLRRNPQMTAYLFDYPDVVRKAGQVLADHGVSARVTVEGGDLNQAEIPAGHDAYLLKAVLHWMSDEKAENLLRRIRAQIGDTGARLLVFDSVLAPDNKWDHGKFLDVDMLVLFGGRERSLDDWRTLFERSGFKLVQEPSVYHWTLLECEAV
ncbi:acetylserotonin O-methyltransferase [Nonomuraea sp. NBC_00507]|uniref:methyltransferase n=1 Tax=Nonomuraea sp. NBC_00507 TaxID=2976002 RepID=UPI002E178A1B